MLIVGTVMANCDKCNKCISNNNHKICCEFCNSNYHKRCVHGNFDDVNWLCFNCSGNLFPFNHILDDDEFKFALCYFNNSVEYNRLLSLKFNPYLYECNAHDNISHNNLINYNTCNSCNYVFDLSLDLKCSFKDGFSILHLNSRSFNKNRDFIDIFISNLKHTFSIIALSETWFKEDDSNLVDISNYTLVSVPRHVRKSGGVALYVHSALSFKHREDLNLIQPCNQGNDVIDHSESVFVEIISPNSGNVIVGNIYRAHKTDIDLFNYDLSNCLQRIVSENKNCYISGDFNLDLLCYNTDQKVTNFVNTFYANNMFPLIDRPTRITSTSATILDNIFTNVLTKRIKSGVCVTDITDHYPIFQITNSLEIKHNTPKSFSSRSFNDVNINCFKNHLQLTNWDNVLTESSPIDAYNKFFDKFMELYNRCFPIRRKRIKAASHRIPRKPWVTQAILKSIRHKDKLYRKYRSSQTESNKIALVNYKNSLTTLLRVAKKQYYSDLLDDHKNNLKQTWNVLNDLLGRTRKQQVPDSFDINGTPTSDSQKIADGFNSFFTNIGPNLTNQIPVSESNFNDFLVNIQSPMNSLFMSPTDSEEIIKICATFKSGTSCGYDGIKPDIVKYVINLISSPLVHIFNLSIITGIVPEQLKIAKVVPIYKSGEKNKCNNYRPISVLPAFSKILERIIHKRLYNFLDRYNLLHNSQFGFRNKYSSYMAVLEAYNKIVSNLDKGKHTLGLFLDLSKAFDTISHSILLDKLHHYGVRGNALEWFKSYLTNRSQFVVYDNSKSSILSVQCGVPQGSVLGPLLFIIFLNDIAFSSDTLSFFIYADDTNAIVSNDNLNDLIHSVNNELHKICTWFKANKLSLNTDKTNYMMFKNRHSNRKYPDLNICIDGTMISKVSHTKFLGIIFDDTLTWSKHTSHITNIVSKYSGILFRLKHILPCKTLFSLYNTLVLPHLHYCSLIWADSNNTNLVTIHIKQKRIIRLCSNSHWLAHSAPLFKNLNTLTIYDIHKLLSGLFMYNFTYKSLPQNFADYFVQNRDIHTYSTRTLNLYRPQNFKYDLARNTIKRQGPLLWNSIDYDLRKAPSHFVFKRKYKLQLLSSYN